MNKWDRFREKDLMHVFSRFQFFFFKVKYPLHIASYALRIGVSVMELCKALNL